jgi:tetratricopeptide (TPR) repeat protein
MFDDAEQLPRIGRYEVMTKLGQGGMGTVYRAHDPELGRDVAVKFIACNSEDGRARALVEARSLASLSHPNVAQVFDVGEVGVASAFIAMELVEGVDLGAWLRARPRATAEVLDVMRGAARGLAAAHDAGLVHRDFKPSNVVVGDDGVPRIIDFGIAVAGGVASLAATSSDNARATTGPYVAGTPPYMSPEQGRGLALDGRSDQYAFCAVLHEALIGRRPDRDDAGVAQPSRTRPRDIPAPLWRVICRGLDRDPDRRFESMHALLAALVAPSPRRMRPWHAAVLVAVGFGVLFVSGAPSPSRCLDDTVALHWHAARRVGLAAAFVETGAAHAAETFERVTAGLDEYATRWAQARSEVCALAPESGSSESADRASQCLSRQRDRVVQVLEALGNPGASTIDKAAAAVAELAPPASCIDAATRHDEELGPHDLAHERFWKALGNVEALDLAGRIDDGLVAARASVAEATNLGSPAAIAAARTNLGALLVNSGRLPEAHQELGEAYFVAAAAGLERRASRALAMLIYVAVRRSAFDEAQDWARHAEMHLARDGGDARSNASLEMAIGMMWLQQAHPERALEWNRRAVAALEAEGIELPALAMSLNNLASVHFDLGASDEAIELFKRALELNERLLGPHHPDVAMGTANLGIALEAAGRLEDAERQAMRALELGRGVATRDAALLSTAHITLGNVAVARRDWPQALEHYDAALRTPFNDLQRARVTVSVARVYAESGDVPRATQAYDSAIAQLEAAVDADHFALTTTRAEAQAWVSAHPR